jgi:hypothetical protein
LQKHRECQSTRVLAQGYAVACALYEPQYKEDLRVELMEDATDIVLDPVWDDHLENDFPAEVARFAVCLLQVMPASHLPNFILRSPQGTVNFKYRDSTLIVGDKCNHRIGSILPKGDIALTLFDHHTFDQPVYSWRNLPDLWPDMAACMPDLI